jgi:hypothetical protein
MRTARHDGYKVSKKKRERIEESFGWLKTNRADAEGVASGDPQGRVGVYLRGRGLQPDADAESTVAGSSNRVSRGRSAPKSTKWRSWTHSNTYENATFRVLGSPPDQSVFPSGDHVGLLGIR